MPFIRKLKSKSRSRSYRKKKRSFSTSRSRSRHKDSKQRDRERKRYREKDYRKDDYEKDHRKRREHSEENEKKERYREKKVYLKDVELGKVYDGKVTKVHDYGCFVALDNFEARKEGLVHISNIRDQRVLNAFEAVKRNQSVKIKVISIVGSKISLSMKEVDQETGIYTSEKQYNNIIISIFP